MEITNVLEYEEIAKKKLPKMWTLKENRNAFLRILFRPRILVDVSHIDVTTTVLGFKISMPIMIAPTAMQKMAHPDVEYATARDTSGAGIIMIFLIWAASSVEKIASTELAIRFLQLSEADIKNRFALPPYLTLKNFEVMPTNDSGLATYAAEQLDQSLSWKDVKWLQTITTLPILVKGGLTAEDTRLAIQVGAAGIIVSNHGAWQLDYVPATIMALEEYPAQGKIPVFRDGGVRHRTNVFKALALGASGIFQKSNRETEVILPCLTDRRPVVFSLAAKGEAGVKKVLQMPRDEFELTMALSGCRSLKEITHDHIMTGWDRPRIAPRL
ncbi:hypothetical protein EUGRSUZ_E02418 [Eucalyptus grandis]|uniref:FMN hydroxy acid dehydrogenase domain-containing protein n=2 Tax=Eucalyptus grandis TaxID=71139 RepID=A0A059C7A6_EUCGR|nr:hypothetical protein EUGRSUZ_E02418 [Eucalyptus grandis]